MLGSAAVRETSPLAEPPIKDFKDKGFTDAECAFSLNAVDPLTFLVLNAHGEYGKIHASKFRQYCGRKYRFQHKFCEKQQKVCKNPHKFRKKIGLTHLQMKDVSPLKIKGACKQD